MDQTTAVAAVGVIVLCTTLAVRAFRACAISQKRGLLDDASPKPRTFIYYQRLPSCQAVDWLSGCATVRAANAVRAESAVVRCLFTHAAVELHDQLVTAAEEGRLPPHMSVRSLSPMYDDAAFVVDVGAPGAGAGGGGGRVLVRVSHETPGNREEDGVNARERVPPRMCEMVPEALHRPTPRRASTAHRVCAPVDEAVAALLRLAQ